MLGQQEQRPRNGLGRRFKARCEHDEQLSGHVVAGKGLWVSPMRIEDLVEKIDLPGMIVGVVVDQFKRPEFEPLGILQQALVRRARKVYRKQEYSPRAGLENQGSGGAGQRDG